MAGQDGRASLNKEKESTLASDNVPGTGNSHYYFYQSWFPDEMEQTPLKSLADDISQNKREEILKTPKRRKL